MVMYTHVAKNDVAYALTRRHEHDAGLDLASAETVTIAPMGRALISTNIAVAIPKWAVGMVCSRSGLAINTGVFVLNAPGIIDSGFRGEVGVILMNPDPDCPYTVKTGDRIAQLVIIPRYVHEPKLVDSLPAPDDLRGEGGFGSTGD